MALGAAVACLRLEGRRETASEIRDAVCLARVGDALGPAGDMFMVWRRLARINLTASGWQRRLVGILPDQIAEAMPELGSTAGQPVAQAGPSIGGRTAAISATGSGSVDVGGCDPGARDWLGSGDAVAGGEPDSERHSRDF